MEYKNEEEFEEVDGTESERNRNRMGNPTSSGIGKIGESGELVVWHGGA